MCVSFFLKRKILVSIISFKIKERIAITMHNLDSTLYTIYIYILIYHKVSSIQGTQLSLQRIKRKEYIIIPFIIGIYIDRSRDTMRRLDLTEA